MRTLLFATAAVTALCVAAPASARVLHHYYGAYSAYGAYGATGPTGPTEASPTTATTTARAITAMFQTTTQHTATSCRRPAEDTFWHYLRN